jgi:pimeloyl-ACP methyl ester carboxylesterase
LGFALQAPERVGLLGLVDSYGLGNDLPGGVVSYALVHSPLNRASWAALRLMARRRRLARLVLRAALPRHPERAAEPLVGVFRRLLRAPNAGAAFRQLQRQEAVWLRCRTSYAGRFADVRVPTLIIHGANDPAVPVAWAERAHGQIPGSQLIILPECGHIAPLEQPEAFNDALLGFLAGKRS